MQLKFPSFIIIVIIIFLFFLYLLHFAPVHSPPFHHLFHPATIPVGSKWRPISDSLLLESWIKQRPKNGSGAAAIFGECVNPNSFSPPAAALEDSFFCKFQGPSTLIFTNNKFPEW